MVLVGFSEVRFVRTSAIHLENLVRSHEWLLWEISATSPERQLWAGIETGPEANQISTLSEIASASSRSTPR